MQTRLRDVAADLSEATRTLDVLRRAREIVEGQLRASRLKSAEAESKVADSAARVESFAKERERNEAAVKEIESRLTTSIVQLEAAKSESESRLAERFSEIAALTRLLGDRDAHIGSMREQIADRDTKLARLSLEKETENQSLRAQMAENETRLARLSLEKEAENQGLRAQMTENETRLARLSVSQEQATHEAQTLERALASAKSKLADAESSLSERFSEIARITNKFLEKDVLARKFEEHATWLRSMALILVPASRSWRSRLSAWLPLAIHRTRQMDRLRREGIFDSAAYLAAHPDVARASVEPFRHYLAHGIREGRRLGVEGR
jgi:chromosome segregation ATPase